MSSEDVNSNLHDFKVISAHFVAMILHWEDNKQITTQLTTLLMSD